MDEKSRIRIDVEPDFNAFVLSFGGELVSNVVGKNPRFENADYIFKAEGLVAELKCLEKSFLDDINYKDKVAKAHRKWVEQGLISQSLHGLIKSTDLPEKCQLDLLRILEKPLNRVVTKANRQIRETKSALSLDHAKGLLIIANDGNYSLESEVVLYLTTKLVRSGFSSINCIVYFTANMRSRVPGSIQDVFVWARAHGGREEDLPRPFLDAMGDAWINFVSKKTGIEHEIAEVHESILQQLRFLR